MVTIYPDAIQMLVPYDNVFWNCNPSYAIVIHGTAGWQGASAQGVANMFATVPDKRSSHFIIGRDGVVAQCVTLENGAGANCCLEPGHDPFWDIGVANLNTVTISIEHVHWTTDNSEPLTDVQKQTGFKLVRWLCDTCNVPTNHIKGHKTLDPQSRAHCPGNYPWQELFTFLQNGGATLGVPAG